MKAGSFVLLLLVVLCVWLPRTTVAQTATTAETKADAAHTLSSTQRQALERIKVETEKKAGPAAMRLAGIVQKIYENMLADNPNEKLRSTLSAQMKEAAWQLLLIKGQATREAVYVLTPEQKQLIKNEMRKPGAPADLSEVIAQTFKIADK